MSANGDNPLLIIDLDDTILATQQLYDDAKEKFYKRMAWSGLDREEIEKILIDVDRANIDKMGLSPHRFPRSMAEAYKKIVEQTGRMFFQHTRYVEVMTLGYKPYTSRPNLIPGATVGLRKLWRQEYAMVLYTSGQAAVQAEKVWWYGLESRFQRVYIADPDHYEAATMMRVPTSLAEKMKIVAAPKCAVALRNIIDIEDIDAGGFGSYSPIIVIGNSLRSDIAPANEIGALSILFEDEDAPKWDYEHRDHKHETPTALCSDWKEMPYIVGRVLAGRINMQCL